MPTVIHLTLNTGHSSPVLHPPAPGLVRHLRERLRDGSMAVAVPEFTERIRVQSIDTGDEHFYCWGLFHADSCLCTCFFSPTESATRFGEAVEFARTSSEALAKLSGKDSAALFPYRVLREPPAPWLATMLHVPFFKLPPSDIGMVPDFNQCLAYTFMQ